jgi:hypothetical protein
MLGIFSKPVVELKLKNPKWVCGRQLTWVDVSIVGSCRVTIKAESNPDWQPVKMKSIKALSGSIAAPIGAMLTIEAKTLMGKTITNFEVAAANWNINAPEVPKIVIGAIEPAKPLIQVWRSYVRQLEKTKPVKSRTSIKKIMLKPKFINMRVSKNTFNHREATSNDRSVHLKSE